MAVGKRSLGVGHRVRESGNALKVQDNWDDCLGHGFEALNDHPTRRCATSSSNVRSGRLFKLPYLVSDVTVSKSVFA